MERRATFVVRKIGCSPRPAARAGTAALSCPPVRARLVRRVAQAHGVDAVLVPPSLAPGRQAPGMVAPLAAVAAPSAGGLGLGGFGPYGPRACPVERRSRSAVALSMRLDGAEHHSCSALGGSGLVRPCSHAILPVRGGISFPWGVYPAACAKEGNESSRGVARPSFIPMQSGRANSAAGWRRRAGRAGVLVSFLYDGPRSSEPCASRSATARMTSGVIPDTSNAAWDAAGVAGPYCACSPPAPTGPGAAPGAPGAAADPV